MPPLTRSVETEVEVDAAMVVAVALVEAMAVGGHGHGHGRRDGRDSLVAVVKNIVYTSELKQRKNENKKQLSPF